jgi:hypothetical protein
LSALPELAEVWWRPRLSEHSLRRRGQLWTAITVAHTLPFLAVAGLLVTLKPLLAPVAAIALVHAWSIPELYAARGAKVLGNQQRRSDGTGAQRIALGLLGDLLAHAPRALLARSGLVLERGGLGAWLVGETGAVLVRPGGRRVYCFCVRTTDPELPPADRIAHLLLALRADEAGFATLANLAFSGARWRLARRLPAIAREALHFAAQAARTS